MCKFTRRRSSNSSLAVLLLTLVVALPPVTASMLSAHFSVSGRARVQLPRHDENAVSETDQRGSEAKVDESSSAASSGTLLDMGWTELPLHNELPLPEAVAVPAVEVGSGRATAAGYGEVSFRVPGGRRPQLLVHLVNRSGVGGGEVREIVAVQEHLRVYTTLRKKKRGKYMDVHLKYNITCVTPGTFHAVVLCEQDGTSTGHYPPPQSWITTTKLNTLRDPRYRPDDYRNKAYTKGMPLLKLVKVARHEVECVSDPERVAGVLAEWGESRSNVFPRGGSWIQTEQHLPPNPGIPWDATWFERYAKNKYYDFSYHELRKTSPSLFVDLEDPNFRNWAFEPHDLLRGSPIRRLYLPEPEGEQVAFVSELAKRPLFAYFMGDSVVNNVWEAFMAMAPPLMKKMQWDQYSRRAERVIPARGVVGTQTSSLMKWFHDIAYDRYSNYTNFALNAGAFDPLYLKAGRQPTHVVIGAGLWDAQSRPPSAYAKYFPILISSLRRMFGPSTHIIWLVMPPVDIAKKPGRHYRTNEFLLAASRIAKTHLADVEGVTVVDGHTILSGMRSRSWDGLHYPAMWALDIANIVWNVVLST